MKIIIVMLMCVSFAVAQDAAQVYEIPFASKGNTIELAVANNSGIEADSVTVVVTSTPECVKFTEKKVVLSILKAQEEQTATFSFDIEKTAKVNNEQTISFTITDKKGQQWTKEVKIRVAAPTTYELFQNYPNPFNPTTTIEYQLPGTGNQYHVSLKIYDLLGREVAHLVNEQQQPGGHQATFDARQYASGMYIYRLIATDGQNNNHTFQKRMMLLK